MALLLLDNGGNIHAVTEPCQESALHLAIKPARRCYHGPEKHRLALVKFLLDRGVDVMTKDSKGNTPLHTFFTSGFDVTQAGILDTLLTILKSLIERGADLKSKNNNGQTPRDIVNGLTFWGTNPKKLIEIIDPKPDDENREVNERSELQLEPQ
jgi:ankyrin repeat protein